MLALPAHQRPESRYVRGRGAIGDGAAGVVLRSSGDGRKARGKGSPTRAWSNTEHIMGWDIKSDGFGIVLSADLPTLMRERLGEALLPFFAREGGYRLHDFDGFLLHPGGSKVLETAENALGLSRDQLRYSWQVLKN